MSGNIKFRWFLIAFLLITLFCSSCAWIKSNGQWSFKKRDLKSEILKNPNDYDANYDLGVKGFQFPLLIGKRFFFSQQFVI